MQIFDRKLLKLRRNKIAGNFHQHDFLKKRAVEIAAERVEDIKGDFDYALDIGCHTGEMQPVLKRRAKHVISCDIAENMIQDVKGMKVAADEENLPFADNSFDLITSVLTLHNTNDLPGVLLKINRMLRKDGVFIASILGGDTLKELRTVLTELETEYSDGIAPRIAPFAEVKSMGALLQRAGFAMPVSDIETVRVSYSNVFELIKDLKAMGENNILIERKNYLNRKILANLDKRYKQKFSDGEGWLTASFDVITLLGIRC